MTAVLVTPPAVEPVSLADMHAQLRLSATGEDNLIAAQIRAARAHVEGLTRRALISQGWRKFLDHWPEGRLVLLGPGPVQSVDGITLYDASGLPTALDPGSWHADLAAVPARLKPALGVGSTDTAMNGIEIEFTAGYGPATEDVPDALRQAIRLLAAHWFEYREADAAALAGSIPGEVGRLCAPFKVARL